MGGQACVLYGAAEFSRDTDLAILAEPENLAKLQVALDDLQAVRIAVPPFEQRYLDMGLAIHFRCQHEDCRDMRIDIMSRMRGVDAFNRLWDRRTTAQTDDGPMEVLSLPDLVQAKKTQRDKDWPMITRLVESNFFEPRREVTNQSIQFWLRELRTPELLLRVVQKYPYEAEVVAAQRPLLKAAAQHSEKDELRRLLQDEEKTERAADQAYWLPLRKELERLRRESHGKN
jgi:hypothetical protein